LQSIFSIPEVAWYGAIVATLTFAFSVWKWASERAKLRIRIVETVYEDGGYSKVEKTETGGEMSTPNVYYHIEVINVGERPTTIMGVSATSKRTFVEGALWRGKSYIGYWGKGFTPHYGKNLPHVIGQGEVWSCRILKENITGLSQAGRPKLELTDT
jgi:hypothetical protein